MKLRNMAKSDAKRNKREEKNLGEELDQSLDRNSLIFFRLSEL